MFPARLSRGCRFVLLAAGLALLAVPAPALKPSDHFTLQDLERAPALTPGQFADLFEDFAYEYDPSVQPPEVFLQERRGDCDDYAILGAYILGLKGYKTRLIQVQLVGTNVDHAVCYVTDKRVYLDYNDRKYTFNLGKSRPTVRDIAEKVADSFEQNWTTAFEFTYSYAEPGKKILWVVVKTDSAARDPDRLPPPARP
jgi:hypothetical protein